MKILNSPLRQYAKLKKRYLKTVHEYTQLRLLVAEKPLLSEKEFKKIETRIARLDREMDDIRHELTQFKPLRGVFEVMEEVLVETWSGRNKTKLFQAILLEGKYAIFSRMGIVQMIGVEPAKEEGVYKPTESRDNYTIFLGTGGRSISALEKYAKRILEMSAFELLTKHYDPVEEVFFILSDKKPNF